MTKLHRKSREVCGCWLSPLAQSRTSATSAGLAGSIVRGRCSLRACDAPAPGINTSRARVGESVTSVGSPLSAAPVGKGSPASASPSKLTVQAVNPRAPVIGLALLDRKLKGLPAGAPDVVCDLDDELVAAARQLCSACLEAVCRNLYARRVENAPGDVELQEPVHDLQRRDVDGGALCCLEMHVDVDRRLYGRTAIGPDHADGRGVEVG